MTREVLLRPGQLPLQPAKASDGDHDSAVSAVGPTRPLSVDRAHGRRSADASDDAGVLRAIDKVAAPADAPWPPISWVDTAGGTPRTRNERESHTELNASCTAICSNDKGVEGSEDANSEHGTAASAADAGTAVEATAGATGTAVATSTASGQVASIASVQGASTVGSTRRRSRILRGNFPSSARQAETEEPAGPTREASEGS